MSYAFLASCCCCLQWSSKWLCACYYLHLPVSMFEEFVQDWLDFNWNDPQVSCRCPICLPYHVLCVSQGLALFSVSPAMLQAIGCCDCRIWSPNFSSLFAPQLPEVQSVSACHLPVACLSPRRVREQAFAWPPSVSLLPNVCDAWAAEQKLAFNISQLFLLSSCDGIKVDLSGGSQCVCVFNDVYLESGVFCRKAQWWHPREVEGAWTWRGCWGSHLFGVWPLWWRRWTKVSGPGRVAGHFGKTTLGLT